MNRTLRGTALWLACFAISMPAFGLIINGKEVAAGQYPEVVRITANGYVCAATVVGPRVIATAAHCAPTGTVATFTAGGASYSAKIIRSPIYPSKGTHDIAIGITATEIKGVTPVPIGGKFAIGLPLTLLGYGCKTKAGLVDGVLRMGTSTTTASTQFHMISQEVGGGTICYGDDGGPSYVKDESNRRYLLGVHSTTNLVDRNYDTRTDTAQSVEFLTNTAHTESVLICGISPNCNATDTPIKPPIPPTKAPSCSLSANPVSVELGDTLQLNLLALGEVTDASIEGSSVGFPTGTLSWKPNDVGTFTAHGKVSGPGGSGLCEATYLVKARTPDPVTPRPTCTLSASPASAKVGENVQLELATNGSVSSASIEGVSVSFPLGRRLIATTRSGTFTAVGNVTGPGGSNQCTGSYQVVEVVEPPTPITPIPIDSTPALTVVPVYCGMNTLPETKVTSVCLCVLKQNTSRDLRVSQAIMITYSDLSTEVLPVLSRAPQTKAAGDSQSRDAITVYANGAVKGSGYQVLDTRVITLTKNIVKGGGEVPARMEGRSSRGNYFIIERMGTK